METNGKVKQKFPYKIQFVDDVVNLKLLANFHGEKTGFVQVGDEKWFFPSKYEQAAEHFYGFEARASDVWIATFPRSGTTWTQEMVWMICNKLNAQAARSEPLAKRVPFFELHIYMHDLMKQQLLSENPEPLNRQIIEDFAKPAYEVLAATTERRFIKTHFPFSLLPPSIFKTGAKLIYVARNPADVVVSYYHLNKLYRTQGYVGDFANFYNYFENNLTPWSPYWTHLKQGWKARHFPNVLFMFYEDMKANLPKTIRTVAEFLEVELSDQEVDRLTEHLSVASFKKNPSLNGQELIAARILNSNVQGFIRNGQVNSSEEEMTDEIRERIRKWTEENLRDTDLRFPVL
ncbi:luciferin sulfotransferase [Topomyia yanbarensis]|uniref:luciferin sulfotransferase n=1 Tax=Topomyia yanbarensis TaxID=2498891 RepID=UPI00273C31BB|nr:luciferin sulfotransferase [Topomyia yanbarensis]